MTLRARNPNEKVALDAKKITRNNSIKTTAKSAVLMNIQTRKAAPTTVTVKSAILPTVQQVVVKDEQKDNLLKREDSNLSQKSLTKLKAALAKDQSKKITTVPVKTKVDIKVKPEPAKVKPVAKVIPTGITKSHSAKLIKHVENIDARDSKNPILVSEYVNDIYSYLRQLEVEQPVNENFLEGQHVSPRMRAVLIDWINEVHLQFHLIPETFQMTVGIIDRYLQIERGTTRDYLQLVGVTALFIASKYEELYPPSMDDFVYITDNTYSKQEILAMEMKIIRTLGYNLSRPLPIQFLRRCSKAAEASDYHHSMAKYFLELTSTDYTMATIAPSKVAAASLLLSLRLMNKISSRTANDLWTPTLIHYSSYDVSSLQPIVKKIAELAKAAPSSKLQSVYHKYSTSKFNSIALRSELKGLNMERIMAEQ
ncbi:CCNB2 family protein [Megaselia abdita]